MGVSYGQVRNIRPRRRKAAPVFGLWLFLLMVCSLAAYFFLHSAFFSITALEVKGNKTIAAEKIIEQSGLSVGANLFKINTGEARKRLSLHPILKETEISRQLPNTIVISVSERIPVAVVAASSCLIVVDQEGFYLQKTADNQEIGLPVISDISLNGDESPGVNIITPGLRSALDLIEMMDQSFLDNLAEITAPTPNTLALKTKQGVEIRFGEPADMARKVKVMQELLVKNGAVINNQTVEYIDLRYDTAPVVKRKIENTE